MQIYDYECDSETCKPFAPTETFDGFLNYNSRMTNRLEDFACVLAIETSCRIQCQNHEIHEYQNQWGIP